MPVTIKRVTLKHVSEAAGVSVQTASHVLNKRFQDRYRAETREKVVQIAQLLGYRPNAAARSMLNQRSHIVGLLVPITSTSWFFQLDVFETMVGMNKTLANAGYVTSVIAVNDLLEPGEASRAFREQMLDGVVVMGATPQSLRQLVSNVSPVSIWCDTNINQPTGCVRRDEFYSGVLAAQNVVAGGYRKIVWVTYEQPRPEPEPHYSSYDRISGIRSVTEKHGLPMETFQCLVAGIGAERTQLLPLLQKDTAVITEHSHFAQAIVNVAATAHLAPGVDFGLAACDHSRERSTVFPNLSRVVMDRAQIGSQAAEMLLEAMASNGKSPASRLIRGEWFAGDTLGGVH